MTVVAAGVGVGLAFSTIDWTDRAQDGSLTRRRLNWAEWLTVDFLWAAVSMSDSV